MEKSTASLRRHAHRQVPIPIVLEGLHGCETVHVLQPVSTTHDSPSIFKGVSMNDGFGQHYQRMYTGSMVGSGAIVFALMVYIIANTDAKTSCIELNEKLLATILGETEKDIQNAIEFLCAPDPRSRSKTEDGRRLLRRGEFLYYVVTFKEHRNMLLRQRDNIQAAERMKHYRERNKRNDTVTDSNSYACASASVPAGAEIPSLEACRSYASDPACAFPISMVAEFYDRQCDRGWGNDWRARMRAAVATYREMEFKRSKLKRDTGRDVSKPKAPAQADKSGYAWRVTQLKYEIECLTENREAEKDAAALARINADIRSRQKELQAIS